MGSLGPTHLIALLLAVAIIGFIASAVTRNKRRARGFFLLGFFCGWVAGSILLGRRRGLNALGALARCADVRPPRARICLDAFGAVAPSPLCCVPPNGLVMPKWDCRG
jgi:uncharacterized membrane protein YeaQ/YmgE (transglycosylase-associated protein family)